MSHSESEKYLWLWNVCPIFMFRVLYLRSISYLWAHDRKNYWLYDKLSAFVAIYYDFHVWDGLVRVIVGYNGCLSRSITCENKQSLKKKVFLQSLWCDGSDGDFYSLVIMMFHEHNKKFIEGIIFLSFSFRLFSIRSI